LKTYSVIISGAAEADLLAIYDHIAQRAGSEIAFRFVNDIESYCLGFDLAPERGTSATIFERDCALWDFGDAPQSSSR
jgi:plasmid stabilization system protein ParE